MGPEGQEVRGNPQNSQFYFIQFFLLKYGGGGLWEKVHLKPIDSTT